MRFDNAEFEAAYGTFKQLPNSTQPEILFSGRSNVGKSSLLNKILNRKSLARVSSVPGKTITINFYKLDGVKFIDLPGYGYAKASKVEKKRWSDMINQFFDSVRDIRLVVQLLDMRHPPTEDDKLMLDYLTQMNYPFIIALTKSDKLNKTEYSERLSAIRQETADFNALKIIPFSSSTGEGVKEVKAAIEFALK